MLPVDRINKAVMAWVTFCIVVLGISVGSTAPSDAKFWRIGPHDELSILNVKINTPGRYVVVVSYTMISTVVRTVLQEIIQPWLIQVVQNDKPKDDYAHKHAQEVAIGEVIYRWFDWFMYMNILLVQIDMMTIELVGNIIAVIYTTRMYMKPKKREEDTIELISNSNECA